MSDLDPLLKRLHLAHSRRAWRELVARAEAAQWSYETFLQTLLAEEIAHRRGTRLMRAVRAADLPFLRTVEEFDFSYQSTLRLTTMGSLLSPDFVTEGNAVILYGPTGRGKTHLAVALAYRAMQNGFDALFVNCAKLIAALSSASREGRLREALAAYVRPHVLVVDEVGYLTYGDDAANVLFHVVNERHIKRRAMVFTTNKNPRGWGPVLHDDDLADAIVDRILHRGRVLKLDGPSLRTKHLANDPVLSETHDHDDPRRVSGTGASEFLELARVSALHRSHILHAPPRSRPRRRSRTTMRRGGRREATRAGARDRCATRGGARPKNFTAAPRVSIPDELHRMPAGIEPWQHAGHLQNCFGAAAPVHFGRMNDDDHFDPQARAAEKQASREADEAALASGAMRREDLRQENAAIASLRVRPDFAAAHARR